MRCRSISRTALGLGLGLQGSLVDVEGVRSCIIKYTTTKPRRVRGRKPSKIQYKMTRSKSQKERENRESEYGRPRVQSAHAPVRHETTSLLAVASLHITPPGTRRPGACSSLRSPCSGGSWGSSRSCTTTTWPCAHNREAARRVSEHRASAAQTT